MEEEKFVHINGFEDYLIGNFGTVISLKNNGRLVMKGSPDVRGYLRVNLSKNGKHHCKKIHQLVALHFIPNPKPGIYTIVNHKDNNHANNHYTNLEWCDQQYNKRYQLLMGTANVGENSSSTTLTNQQALEIYDLAHNSNLTQIEIGELYNVSPHVVSSIKNGKTWNHITQHYPISIEEYLQGKNIVMKTTRVKLTDHQVLDIYRLATKTNYTIDIIAFMFGVSNSTVLAIKNKRYYKRLLDNLP